MIGPALSSVILFAANGMSPVVHSAEQSISKNSKLEALWDSYRHAEYEATGGYNCDRKQHKIIVEAFERRFSKRVARLRSVVGERLGGQATDRSFDVIAICQKYTSLSRLKAGLDRDLTSFETVLAQTEDAFGIK